PRALALSEGCLPLQVVAAELSVAVQAVERERGRMDELPLCELVGRPRVVAERDLPDQESEHRRDADARAALRDALYRAGPRLRAHAGTINAGVPTSTCLNSH